MNGSNLLYPVHPCHGRSPPQHRDVRRTAELLRKGGAAAAHRGAAAAAESAPNGGAAQCGGLQRGAAVRDGEGHQKWRTGWWFGNYGRYNSSIHGGYMLQWFINKLITMGPHPVDYLVDALEPWNFMTFHLLGMP